MRMGRRAGILKRDAEAAGRPFNVARASTPHYSSIQNVSRSYPKQLTSALTSSPQTTCLTAPEIVEGPYYVNNELVRQDNRENQK